MKQPTPLSISQVTLPIIISPSFWFLISWIVHELEHYELEYEGMKGGGSEKGVEVEKKSMEKADQEGVGGV